MNPAQHEFRKCSEKLVELYSDARRALSRAALQSVTQRRYVERQNEHRAARRDQLLGERLSEVIRPAAQIVIDDQFHMRMFSDSAENLFDAVRHHAWLSRQVTPRRRGQIEESA
ncbi:hypothetical protein ACXIVK_37175 [Paraburkholderia caledonica]